MSNERADVVVVGGGVVGASVAWHLTELGITDVVLVERDVLASGSTHASAGGVRTQFSDELNIRIALRSLAEFESFEDRFGVDIGFHQLGYLFLVNSLEDTELFRAALELQHELGVPSCALTPDEARRMVPQLETADLLGATFCELDGYATPEAVVRGYATAAVSRGVRIRQRCAVEGIVVRSGRIEAVETGVGLIETETVVCAAGAWSAEVAMMAGIELPVHGEPRWMFFSSEDGGLPLQLPLTIDFATGFYFHREGRGLVFGGREQTIEELAIPATHRLPVLADLPIQSSWWGYYEISPDHNAIVGETPEPSRLLYATGFSGHGFQQAPAVGEHLAELVAGVEPALDLSPFSLERFGRGEERAEQFVV